MGTCVFLRVALRPRRLSGEGFGISEAATLAGGTGALTAVAYCAVRPRKAFDECRARLSCRLP